MIEPALVADAIGSVAFHPIRSMLLSAAGSRHFDAGSQGRAKQRPPVKSHESLSSEEDDDSDLEEENATFVALPKERPQPFAQDSCIKVWNFGGPRPVP